MSTDTPDPTETEAFRQVCRELVDRILTGDVDRENLEAAKREVCSAHAAPKVPKNSELLDFAADERREDLEGVLRRKPVRTASGVSPVAIMTSPERCPHGKCLYCPGGPDSEFSSAQSYTGHEPAAARGVQNDYDPYGQVRLRLEQLREIGHPVDKVELILMGGTMTARSHDYQEWFVRRALEAMNDYDPSAEPEPAEGESFAQDPEEYEWQYLEDVIAANETGSVRNVATTFETKPDWCDPEQIDRMLRLGGTKVEVGVQTTYERINREMHRGHGVQASVDANRRLRDAGFKVGFHMMPGQPGMSERMCVEDFRRLFERPEWRPDYLKIYPTLIVEGTATYDMWRCDEFEPLSSDRAAELVAEIKSMIPPYTRLQRVQRDIPADFIEAGVRKSNLRQLARQRMAEHGWTCDCIRCREVGMNDEDPGRMELLTHTYEAGGGTETFVSFEDPEKDLLVGFCRLRFPADPVRRELDDAAVVRELHVYGSQVGLGQAGGDDQHQHRGYGRRLLAEAERLAADAGYGKLAVLSGIGVRQYYREKLGYRQDGPYVSRRL
ncbi:tRNA uridine(34) 5-carboxymethylaminomethyl modification radical SAM/GNAT enzyme Elp3 [Halobacteriales archaeon QS_1_68_17]|nr:MAG: tRNA uridine(34) 5-carboxymethylaminomethyl modification radical SAM/GNAT enzyme Elp3 [Halobacteriales archaeon QS_1_68_17]